ncbi:alpha/beta hydrolase [Kitasatospora sp. NPDC058190]|uniref:alpha/beta hydrolase n=1 Tax=Kitasatospora sp. NPDC058190 TaxID=3346371 RepID=UPI0036D93472
MNRHLSRRTVAKSALLASAALLLDAGRARAALGGLVPALPAPTGRHPVGRHSCYLVDTSRRDPWASETPFRELMLTVYYPACSVAGRAPAPQLPPQAADAFGQILPQTPLQLPGPGVDWAGTLSHSCEDAAPLPGRRPVLVHSPGGGDPRGLGTTLAEELVSHGAVVVSVDHPGDALAVEFPGTTPFRRDQVRTTVLRGDPRDQPDVFRTMIDARIADLHFVLERLRHAADLPLPPGLAATLDLRRLGVYGHSAGATAVSEVLHEDRRIRAGINLEGYLDSPSGELLPVAAQGVDRPLLLVGSTEFTHRREMDRSWSALLARAGRTVRRALVADADHWVFTDFAAVLPQLQAAGLITAERRNAVIGSVPPAVSVPEVRRTIRRFFARHLTV